MVTWAIFEADRRDVYRTHSNHITSPIMLVVSNVTWKYLIFLKIIAIFHSKIHCEQLH